MAQPTAGDVLVFGRSVRSAADLAAVRRLTGVCPQFDVLWPELTAREHLELFWSVKGVGGTARDAALEFDRLLGKVRVRLSLHVARRALHPRA